MGMAVAGGLTKGTVRFVKLTNRTVPFVSPFVKSVSVRIRHSLSAFSILCILPAVFEVIYVDKTELDKTGTARSG